MPPRLKFLVGLVSFTVVLRLLPYILTAYDQTVDPGVIFYPWNFMPLMAFCLYSGAYVADKRWSMVPPLLALFISDLGIWAATGQFSRAFPSDSWTVYVCHMITVLLGSGLNQNAWPARGFNALCRGMLAETIFFVVTNFAYFCGQTDLPHTATSLVACYVAAIPFAGRSFVSTAFYSVLLFSPLAVRAASQGSGLRSFGFGRRETISLKQDVDRPNPK